MPLEASDIQDLATTLQNLQPSQSPAQVNATAIKLPSFWQGNPEVWFRQWEVELSTAAFTATFQMLNVYKEYVSVSRLAGNDML